MTTAHLRPGTEDDTAGADLGGFDLNLLVVLGALLRQRNITHAGTDLRMSQLATSRALARLRQFYNDDLLVRHSRSFELTPLANRLFPKVAAVLRSIDRIFSGRAPAPGRFAVAMPDHLALLLAGSLAGYFRQVSPATVFFPVTGMNQVLAQLENGQIDLALGLVADTPVGFFCRNLPEIPALCLCRKGHAAMDGRISHRELGRFLSIRVGASTGTGFGEVFDGLEAMRPPARETITVPDIHTAASLVRDTDAILVLPSPSARYLSVRYELDTFVPAGRGKVPVYQVAMIWHERWHRNGIHAGVRSLVAAHVLGDNA